MVVEKYGLSYVDIYFAQTILSTKEETPLFFLVAYLLAIARDGHLCLKVEEGVLYPNPSCLTVHPEEISFLENKILQAFSSLPDFLCSQNKTELKPLCLVKNRLYLQKNRLLEEECVVQLKRLQKGFFSLDIDRMVISQRVNEEQQEAIKKALISPLSLISGGPGTGKSFTAIELVKAFLASLQEEDRKKAIIKLGAPTGKAAAILEKNILEQLGVLPNLTCGTIHSFLKQGKSLFADLFLVDETSMVDAALFTRLLVSLRGGGRLVLMGDKEQLPPVEAGGFFADLSSDDIFPKTILQKSLRMEKKSLQDLAKAICEGNYEATLRQKGVEIVSSFSSKEILERIWLFCEASFSFKEPSSALKEMEAFRILTSMRKGPLGVESINRFILDRFLMQKASYEYVLVPILLTVNDSLRKLMNGDTGFLYAKKSSLQRGFYTKEDIAYFPSKEEEGKLRALPASVLPPFEWAYALSIHKSQGSEYEQVLILIPPGSEKFGREILYTAVTRAKKEAVLISHETTLKVLLQKSAQKISGLCESLKEE